MLPFPCSETTDWIMIVAGRSADRIHSTLTGRLPECCGSFVHTARGRVSEPRVVASPDDFASRPDVPGFRQWFATDWRKKV
jgi:hypothetical protein